MPNQLCLFRLKLGRGASMSPSQSTFQGTVTVALNPHFLATFGKGHSSCHLFGMIALRAGFWEHLASKVALDSVIADNHYWPYQLQHYYSSSECYKVIIQALCKNEFALATSCRVQNVRSGSLGSTSCFHWPLIGNLRLLAACPFQIFELADLKQRISTQCTSLLG